MFYIIVLDQSILNFKFVFVIVQYQEEGRDSGDASRRTGKPADAEEEDAGRARKGSGRGRPRRVHKWVSLFDCWN